MDEFALRLKRWWPDLLAGIQEVYPEDAGRLAGELAELAACAYQERDPALHQLDAERLLRPDWLQEPDMF